MTLDKWSRTPKHILRMKCLDDVSRKFKPGCFLEIGSGNGDLTSFFIRKNFYGKCYDIGSETRAILKEIFAFKNSDIIEVLDGLEELSESYFDYLFAFEVLEHIEDDMNALLSWSRYLKREGVLLISVPAHMKAFGPEDDAVGHYRRYEKKSLYNLVESCGYKDIAIYNYGFPLGNLTRKISLFLDKKEEDKKELTMEQKSIMSGIERKKITNKISFLFNEYAIFPFFVIQRMFYNRDLGDGYVLFARKQ